jgi:hypothetical protein
MDARTPGVPLDPEALQGHPNIGAENARQGAKTGYMRRVLVVSTLLAAIALVGTWLWLSRTTPTTPTAMTAPAAAPATPEGPVPPRDASPAPGAPTPAGPQSSQPLP